MMFIDVAVYHTIADCKFLRNPKTIHRKDAETQRKFKFLRLRGREKNTQAPKGRKSDSLGREPQDTLAAK